MNFFKIVLALVVLALAALGTLMLWGVLVGVVKLLFYVGLVALVGAFAYKALRKSKPRAELNAWPPDLELEKADRLLEEVRSRRLTD
jgi:4-hydroxybenzoate polyprenyltransferase